MDDRGAPVPSASISGLTWRPLSRPRVVAVRGRARDGVYVLRYRPKLYPIPPAFREDVPRVSFWVRAAGYIPEYVKLEDWANEALARGANLEGITLVLRREAVVQGTVFGPDGTPVNGARVGVVEDPLDRLSAGAETDARGRFRLTELDPRKRLWLSADAGKLLARPALLDGLLPGEVHHREVHLERVRRVTVTFEAPNPFRGLGISINGSWPPTAMADGTATATVDSGPQHFAFKRGDHEVVKEVRLWLGPHRPEHHSWVHFD